MVVGLGMGNMMTVQPQPWGLIEPMPWALHAQVAKQFSNMMGGLNKEL